MSTKNVRSPVKKLSMRRIKRAFFHILCETFPFLRQKICFFDDGKHIEDFPHKPAYQGHLSINLEEENLGVSDEEKALIEKGWDTQHEIITNRIERQENLYILKDVQILGHTSAIIYQNTVVLNSSAGRFHHNFTKPLFQYRRVRGHESNLYFSMLGLHAGHKHFYHFFIDYLSEFHSVLEAFPTSASLKKQGAEKLVVLVRDDLADFQKQAYEYISEKFPHISFQELKTDEVLDAPCLLFADIKQNVFSSFLTPAYIHFLKSVYAGHVNEEEPASGRYYISRGDVKNRNINNEKEVIEHLEKEGFDVLLPAQLPLAEQIKIFATATCITGGAGAAFTNLIYCKPETNVAIFYPGNAIGSQYLWLAKSLGLRNVSHICSEETHEKRQHFEIPLKLLDQSISGKT